MLCGILVEDATTATASRRLGCGEHQALTADVLPQLLGHALEVFEGDLARLIVVEESEGLEDLLPRVALRHLGGHHRQEVVEADGAGAVGVHVGDHLLHLLLLGLEAQGAARGKGRQWAQQGQRGSSCMEVCTDGRQRERTAWRP